MREFIKMEPPDRWKCVAMLQAMNKESIKICNDSKDPKDLTPLRDMIAALSSQLAATQEIMILMIKSEGESQ